MFEALPTATQAGASLTQGALEAILNAVEGSAAETERIREAVRQLVEGHERLARSTQSLAASASNLKA